jgi:Amt family ammonium transporter
MTAFIYSVVEFWIWGGGWLMAAGYHDFAGSSVVHLVGGTCAFWGAL